VHDITNCISETQVLADILISFTMTGSVLIFTASRPALVSIQSPNQRVLGALTPGVKRSGREADHSPPSSAEVKNTWRYTPTPPIRVHGVVLN
jgi:hypothetical protein